MMRSGLLLAGGSARRFGSSKSLAEVDGRPMIRRVADALASRCDELLVSIGVQEAPRLERILAGARFVRDRDSDQGPIEGFREGFAQARGELVLVAPCDAPFLQPSLYDALLRILGSHDAAVPRHGAVDPVRAVYRRDAVRRALRASPVRSPSALVDRLDAVFLEGPALDAADPMRASFHDVNRREDLEQIPRTPSLRA